MARTPVAYPIFTFRWLAVHALVVRVPGAAESSGRLWAPRGSKRLQEAPRGSKRLQEGIKIFNISFFPFVSKRFKMRPLSGFIFDLKLSKPSQYQSH
jgi:hypothetical protein